MHERRYGALMKPDGEGGEDCRAVTIRMAIERFPDMLEAALHRNAMSRKQRQLRRMPRQALQSSKAIDRGKLANGVHPCVKVEG